MKQTLITLLGSVLKAAAISAALAGVAHAAKQPFLLWFVVTLVAQFILFYLYGEYQDYRLAKDITEKNLKELEILSKITFNVPCAACKVSNEVVINAQEDTKFVCEACKTKNSVYINIESAIITEPLRTSINSSLS
jgi:phage FluMu protein Com